MTITLRQLRIFLAVAEQRHFRRAAESLHLTQPAVSRQISELESDLGQRLFERTTREVALTEAGAAMLQRIDPVLGELEDALAQIRQHGAEQRHRVLIAAVPTLSANLLPAVMADFAQRHPDLSWVLRDQTQTQLLADVRAGEVDFGVAIEPIPSDDLIIETILHDPFYLVCRHDDPLATLPAVPWQRLDGCPLVLLDHQSGSRRVIDRLLREHDVNARVAQQASHPYTAFRMVEAGLGVSVTPGLSLSLLGDSPLVARPFEPPAQRAISLVRRRQSVLGDAAAVAWTHLRRLPPLLPHAMT